MSVINRPFFSPIVLIAAAIVLTGCWLVSDVLVRALWQFLFH